MEDQIPFTYRFMVNLNLNYRFLHISAWMISFLFLFSCGAAKLKLEKDLLKNGQHFDVIGRYDHEAKKQIRFGAYRVENLDLGWLKDFDLGFLIHFNKKKQKIKFDLLKSDGSKAELIATNKLRKTELKLLKNLGLKLGETHYIGGKVKTEQSDKWKFLIENPEDSGLSNDTKGILSDKYTTIHIRGLRNFKGIKKITNTKVKAYEFYLGERNIATVSLIGDGEVWIADDLHPEVELVVSAIMTASLIKEGFGYHD